MSDSFEPSYRTENLFGTIDTPEAAVAVNWLRAIHEAADAARQATGNEFLQRECVNEDERTQLASLFLRAELDRVAKQYNMRTDKLLARMESNCINLIKKSQGESPTSIVPLSQEEQSLLNKVKLRKAF